MHWVIEQNVAREERYDDILDTFHRHEIPFTQVKVVPFAHTLEPDVNPEGRVMVYGSVALAGKVVPQKGWKPGAFANRNFDFEVWGRNKKWAPHILNGGGVVSTFRNIPTDWDPFFIRPCKDNKVFSGRVMDLREYQTWLGRLLVEEGASDLNFDLDEKVIVAPAKEIFREYRFFIVDGKIVTASVYKIGNDVTTLEESFIDDDAYRFVKDILDDGTGFNLSGWMPARAFALDVALTEEGHKIIEINCINSAGLYKANVSKLVLALDDLGKRL